MKAVYSIRIFYRPEFYLPCFLYLADHIQYQEIVYINGFILCFAQKYQKNYTEKGYVKDNFYSLKKHLSRAN